jgi:hypothetical protein
MNLLKPKAIIARTADMSGGLYWACVSCVPCGKWMVWSVLLGVKNELGFYRA